MPSMRSLTAPAPSSSSPAPASATAQPAEDDAGFGVYVHWPFCASKCPYCDFNSHVRAGGIDEPRFLRAYLTRAAALGGACARPPGHQRLLRRRHAIADVGRHRGRDPRCDRQRVERARRCRDHAGGQSVERGGRPFPRLSRGGRQPRVARRAGARRCRPACARPSAHGEGGAGGHRCRPRNLRALLLRHDLRPARTDAAGVAGGARTGPGARGPAPVALPAHDRARDAVRGAARARQAARARRRDGARPLRADPGADATSGPAGLRDLQPRRARRRVPPQPDLLALWRVRRHRPRCAWPRGDGGRRAPCHVNGAAAGAMGAARRGRWARHGGKHVRSAAPSRPTRRS